MKAVRLGIVDLGTNSVRFDVYDIHEDGSFERLFRDKQMIRLGDGVFKNNKLSKDAISRALEAFDEISIQIRKHGVDQLVAFATSAVRDAQDGKDFIKAIYDRVKINIKILQGEEEARLIAKGILNSETTPLNGAYALIDIGGGSTEVNICYKKNVLAAASLDLGAARLAQNYKTGPSNSYEARINAVEALRKHVAKQINAVISKNKWPSTDIMIGSSGTVAGMEKIIAAHQEKIMPMERKVLSKMIIKMIPLDLDQLQKLPGMEAKRCDMILAGAIALEEIMQALGAKQLLSTKLSLRDGIFDQQMERMLLCS